MEKSNGAERGMQEEEKRERESGKRKWRRNIDGREERGERKRDRSLGVKEEGVEKEKKRE